MLPPTKQRWPSCSSRCPATAVVVLFPLVAHAQGSLKFFENYFVTGDVVTGGTSLWRKGRADGLAKEVVPEKALFH